MHELTDLVVEGWERVKGWVLSDGEELERRLARRKSKMARACPRAWCLVVRASDQRIDSMLGSSWREREDHLRLAGQRCELGHEITVDAEMVRWLLRPVYMDRPYSRKKELARKLGVSERTLTRSVERGPFRVRGISLLGGKRGCPVPVVSCDEELDPSSGSTWRSQHWVWWTGYRRLCENVPADLEQRVKRLPVYRPIGIRGRKGVVRGVAAFRGYVWVCPKCRGKVRKIYYPLPAFVGVRLLDEEYPDGHEFGLPECPREFACRSCHGVRFFSMTSAGAWNDVILQLSGGLLYGHEVEKPAWWRSEVEKGRKRRFVAKGMRKSERRDEVRGLLLAGLKRREISARLRVARSRVDTLIDQIYKMEGVHSVGELRGRLRTGVVEDTACTGGMPVSR